MCCAPCSVSLGAQVCEASQVGLRACQVGLWTVHFNKFSRCLFHTLVFENSRSRCPNPLHSHYCTSNESKLHSLIWTGSFGRRATKTHPVRAEGANPLRVSPHTPLSKSEMVTEQSHVACWRRPRPFSMAMFRIALTREGRGPILLGSYTLYQVFCKYPRSCWSQGSLHRLQIFTWCFLDLWYLRAFARASPAIFSHTSHDRLLLMLSSSTTSCLLSVVLPVLHQINPSHCSSLQHPTCLFMAHSV